MNRREFAIKAAEILRERNVRKPVKIKKHVFTVSDDDGNKGSFSVKRDDKMVLYTINDAINVIDACIDVIKEALQNGDEISIKGVGTLRLYHRPSYRTKTPNGEWCDVPAKYVPRFYAGNDLTLAARIYELSAVEREQSKRLHDLDHSQPIDGDDQTDESRNEDDEDLSW